MSRKGFFYSNVQHDYGTKSYYSITIACSERFYFLSISDCLIIIVAFFAYAQSSPVPSIDVNSGHTHIRAVVKEETTLNVTNFPINSTSAPRVSENTTLSEEELTLNFTTDPLQDFETTDISDDGNASQEPTENVDHSIKKCASPETLNYLETPCGTKVLPGPRRCDVNNLFRVKLGAQMLLATLVSLFLCCAWFFFIC